MREDTIESIVANLVQLQFKRTSTDFKPGNFRIQGGYSGYISCEF